MEINTRIKALRRLVQSQSGAAKAALIKEMGNVSEVLETEIEYEELEQNLEILNVIGFRFSDRAIKVLDNFIQTVEIRSLKYSQTKGFAGYIATHSNAESLIVKATEVLVHLRYLETRAVLHILLRLSNHESEAIQKKALSGLESLAKYNLDVFYGTNRGDGIGATPQIQTIEVLESLDVHFLNDQLEGVLRLLSGLLSPTMEGTRWSSDAVTLSRGTTPAEPPVADVRRRSIDLLLRLYGLATTKREKLSVIGVLNSAARADLGSAVKEKTSVMISRDTLAVLDFYRRLVPKEDLQIVQKIESNSYWIYVHAKSEEIKKAARRVENSLNNREEYTIYRTLVGFEGVFDDWSTIVRSGDYFQEKDKRRREIATRLAGEITDATYLKWRDRILLYAETESDDLATFPVFYFFLGEFAKSRPILALKLIKEDTADIAHFLIPILSKLWDGPRKEDVRTLIGEWIASAKVGADNHLFSSAKMFLSTQGVDIELLKRLLAKVDEIKEISTIRQIVSVAITRYSDEGQRLVDELLLPALNVLTRERDANWVFDAWYRREVKELFEKIGPEGDAQVLKNLIVLAKIDYQAEEILSTIAQRQPEQVIDFFCQRIEIESRKNEQSSDEEFEAIPFEFDKLQDPLSRIAGYAVRRIYDLFKVDPRLFEFRGARLLRNIFPEFSDAFEGEMLLLLKGSEEAQFRFVLGVLRGYQGQLFIHKLCKEIVKALPATSPIVNEIGLALETTGVVSGAFGFAEAYEHKRQEILDWLVDPNDRVRAFARVYISDLEKLRESELKRAEESIALRKHQFGED